MKFHLHNSASINLIRSITDQEIRIANDTHTNSLVIAPDTLISPWPVASIAELNEGIVAQLLHLKPELVLIGTGKKQRFPDMKMFASLHQQNIGVEVMNSSAACRTYNILAGDGRQVVAGIILDQE
ncbi:MAG: Mth938-like domain-containing protein [Arenicellales bacterium WSBS_2016_MAG_OTU3]